MTGHQAPTRDPGLQPERTRLAWRRTTLAFTVVAVLAGRQAVQFGVTAPGLMGLALTALAWLGFLGVAHLRIQQLSTPRPAPLTPRTALAAFACVAGLAVFAVAILP
ncbi:DUF202 domain-containing protein [Streptomyces sannanensis]|uniref:DUF202 domain-containing protein n=1 Tax=Streptomyces sannanensis TaxID=285536 RepID=A0ABP6SJF2_9ACTN